MQKFSLEFLRTYIDNDNQDALGIYNDLASAYELSLSVYPIEINLIGVYFYDIIKILTLSNFKKKEINFGIAPNDRFVTRSLKNWPYLGYQDIKEGCSIESKEFGKGLYVAQKNINLLVQNILNFRYFFGSKNTTKMSVLSPKIDTASNMWIDTPEIMTQLVKTKKKWFALPQLEDQLEQLEQIVTNVMENNNHLLSPKLLTSLLKQHIKADCLEGKSKIHFEGDILLLKSGVELLHRMLSVTAMQQGLTIANILHGEAFGVLDEPIWSYYGEQMYSNLLLGFGERIVNINSSFQYGIKNNVKYIGSNGIYSQRNFKPTFKGINFNGKKIMFYYYPSTLSGASHRYGPYRDTADYMYIEWQKQLFNLFGDSIKIKLHPKEKYEKLYDFSNLNTVNGTFDDLLREIDVFVFDYIGTAFHIACATDKPIIYFDLGIRNIQKDALISIKERTLYFNIKNKMPSFEEIKDQLIFAESQNNYSNKYSLSGEYESRAKSLLEGINNFHI